MKKLLTAFVFTMIGSATFADELVPKELADRVMFEGEIVSSKYQHDGLNFRGAMHELLIRFERKFYHCRVTQDYRDCYEFGKKYWLYD